MQNPPYAGMSVAATARPIAAPGQARARNRAILKARGRKKDPARWTKALDRDTRERELMESLRPRRFSQAVFVVTERFQSATHGDRVIPAPSRFKDIVDLRPVPGWVEHFHESPVNFNADMV
jgi:hypothetical protein